MTDAMHKKKKMGKTYEFKIKSYRLEKLIITINQNHFIVFLSLN